MTANIFFASKYVGKESVENGRGRYGAKIAAGAGKLG
jgi:hypothetical protein